MKDNKETTTLQNSLPNSQTNLIFGKIIKRYQNRKLYDTEQSCYVTLEDIQKMIKANENIVVVDNKSKKDITAATLIQIIFEAEKKIANYPPLSTLREIIQNANGNLSSFFIKRGILKNFNKEESLLKCETFVAKKKPSASTSPTKKRVSLNNEIRQTIEERVAHAALFRTKHNFSENGKEKEDPPHLPNPNQSLPN